MVRVLMLAAALLLCLPSMASAQQQQEITGQWTGSIEWWDGSHTPSAGFTFNEDGTFASERYSGIWTQYGDRAVWIISAGARSVYEMTVQGDTMTGTVNNRQGMRGQVTMRRSRGGGQRADQEGGGGRKSR